VRPRVKYPVQRENASSRHKQGGKGLYQVVSVIYHNWKIHLILGYNLAGLLDAQIAGKEFFSGCVWEGMSGRDQHLNW
jgi:hypothetical protein